MVLDSDFGGRRPDFVEESVFGCGIEKPPSRILDRPQLDEISFFAQ